MSFQVSDIRQLQRAQSLCMESAEIENQELTLLGIDQTLSSLNTCKYDPSSFGLANSTVSSASPNNECKANAIAKMPQSFPPNLLLNSWHMNLEIRIHFFSIFFSDNQTTVDDSQLMCQGRTQITSEIAVK